MRDKGLPRSDRPLAELAKRQHGVVSIRQLTGPLGYSRDAIAGGRGALLSHDSAAWLWGISTRGLAPIAVTSPTPRRPRPPIVLHSSHTLTAEDRALCEGIPVTSVPRALLDVAADARSNRLQRILERSEELKLFDLTPVESVLARNSGHHGAGRLRRAIELYQAPTFTRSALERRFLALVREAGLPQPSTGFNERGFELDRLRQEELKLAGIEMIRVTDVRLDREPARVIERVSRLLADDEGC